MRDSTNARRCLFRRACLSPGGFGVGRPCWIVLRLIFRRSLASCFGVPKATTGGTGDPRWCCFCCFTDPRRPTCPPPLLSPGMPAGPVLLLSVTFEGLPPASFGRVYFLRRPPWSLTGKQAATLIKACIF